MEAETLFALFRHTSSAKRTAPMGNVFEKQVYHFGLLMTGILKDAQAWSPDAYKYLAPEIQR